MSLNLSPGRRAVVLAILSALAFVIAFGRPSSPTLTVPVKSLPYVSDLKPSAAEGLAASALPARDHPRPARWAVAPVAVKRRRRRHHHRRAVQPVPQPVPSPTPIVTSGPVPVGAIQSYAESLVGPVQFVCLQELWTRESGWQWWAANPSGAYGIPQALPGDKMAVAGADWRTNPYTQVKWGVVYYIGPTYGNACNAWLHEQLDGWY